MRTNIENPNSERRKKNTNIATGRVDGKYLEGGDPRGGGERRRVTATSIFFKATMVSFEDVCSKLGLTDERTHFENMTPAVTPLSRETTQVIDQYGRPIVLEERIFNTDGSLMSVRVLKI